MGRWAAKILRGYDVEGSHASGRVLCVCLWVILWQRWDFLLGSGAHSRLRFAQVSKAWKVISPMAGMS